jgi:glucan phosphoethanolaminetransferase (alkaline phosphatase superfamily)
MTSQRMTSQGISFQRTPLQWTLILLAVLGLVVDAVVHLDLASAFAHVKTSTISQADIFRIESVVALLVAAALLLVPRRSTALVALLVAASAVVAVFLYRYVDVGKIGPIPNMYDPYWQPVGKWLSAVAEIVAAVASATLLGVLSPAREREHAHLAG